MAELSMERTWTLSLSNREIILVMKALGGRITSEPEKNEAMDLGDRLTDLRAKALMVDSKVAERLGEVLTDKVLPASVVRGG